MCACVYVHVVVSINMGVGESASEYLNVCVGELAYVWCKCVFLKAFLLI